METNRMRRAVLGCLLAGGLVGARHARGADNSNRVAVPGNDFTFNVPVDLHAITGGAVGGLVSCTAFTAEPAAAPNPPGGEAVGMGGATFTLTNGAFQGTLSVHFGVRAGMKVEDAKGYACTLWFRTANGQEKPASDSSFSRKKGAPLSLDVRGRITP